MAGLKGKSGPPGNMNAFKHGLAAIQKTPGGDASPPSTRRMLGKILDGLIANKGGDISTATKILPEANASDAGRISMSGF